MFPQAKSAINSQYDDIDFDQINTAKESKYKEKWVDDAAKFVGGEQWLQLPDWVAAFMEDATILPEMATADPRLQGGNRRASAPAVANATPVRERESEDAITKLKKQANDSAATVSELQRRSGETVPELTKEANRSANTVRQLQQQQQAVANEAVQELQRRESRRVSALEPPATVKAPEPPKPPPMGQAPKAPGAMPAPSPSAKAGSGGGGDKNSALFAAIEARKAKQDARAAAIDAGEIEVESPRSKRTKEQAGKEKEAKQKEKEAKREAKQKVKAAQDARREQAALAEARRLAATG
jgi:hypothetical protein